MSVDLFPQSIPKLFENSCCILLTKTYVISWIGVATWRWVANDDSCGICRMAFDGCCPDCKIPGDDCPLGKMCKISPYSKCNNKISSWWFLFLAILRCFAYDENCIKSFIWKIEQITAWTLHMPSHGRGGLLCWPLFLCGIAVMSPSSSETIGTDY